MSAIPGLSSRRRAISMMRAAAMIQGVAQEQADPVFQMALICFDPEEDASLRLNAAKQLARYTYQELKPVEDKEAERHEGGLVISWEKTTPGLPPAQESLALPDPSLDASLPSVDTVEVLVIEEGD